MIMCGLILDVELTDELQSVGTENLEHFNGMDPIQ